MKKYKFEFIFVIDPGRDNSCEIIRNLNAKDKRVRYVFMAKRYGKESSMLAGLEYARGNYISIMDVDLQDPIELIPEMVEILESNEYDSVATRRVNRKGEPPIRSFFSNLFYKLMQKASDLDLKSGERDYRLMNRKMLDAVLQSNEKVRFLKGIYGYTGFKTKWLEFYNTPRKRGKTKWSFFKLYKYALACIYNYTSLPLVVINYIGFSFFILSILILIIILILYFIKNIFNNIIIITDIVMFFTSIQIICMSILCQYMYNINIEVKNRPLYIVCETEEDNKKV